MRTFDIKEFAKRIDKSVRTVRRYIGKGKAPNDIAWKPEMKKGKYVFTDKDVRTWQSESPEKNEVSKTEQNLLLNATDFFNEMRTLTDDLSEVKALKAKSESLSNDYEKVKEKYIEAMARIKQLEIENSQLKEQIKDLKNRKFIDMLFRKKQL